MLRWRLLHHCDWWRKEFHTSARKSEIRARQCPTTASSQGARSPQAQSKMSQVRLSWPLHRLCPPVGNHFPPPGHECSTSCYDYVPPPLNSQLLLVRGVLSVEVTMVLTAVLSMYGHRWGREGNVSAVNERTGGSLCPSSLPACTPCPSVSYPMERPSRVSSISHPHQSFFRLLDKISSPGRLS